MMCLAELIGEDLFIEAIDRAVNNHGGNFGCDELARNAEVIKNGLRDIAAKFIHFSK